MAHGTQGWQEIKIKTLRKSYRKKNTIRNIQSNTEYVRLKIGPQK